MISHSGHKAVVEFPQNVTEIETEEGVQYLAEKVYSLVTEYTPDLESRISSDLEGWLNKAKEPEYKETSLADVIEAVNVLTDIIIGG